MSFQFKGSSGSSSDQLIKEVDLGGQKVKIYRSSYERRGQTMHTIRISGAGKDKLMGPQAAFAIIAAAKEIEEYYREVGVIE